MSLVAYQAKKIISIIKLSRQAFAGYKKQIIVLLVLGFFSGAFGAIGINAVIPLFSFVVDAGAGADNAISRMTRQAFEYLHIDFTLNYLILFICALFIFKAILMMVTNYIKFKITADYENKTRKKLLDMTIDANWPYLSKQKIGHLDVLLKLDVHATAHLLQQISVFVLTGTSLLMYTIVAFNVSSVITLITLALAGVMFLVFKPLMYRKRIIGKETIEINKSVAHFINEAIIGMKTIKALAIGKALIKRGDDYFDRLRELDIKNHLYSSVVTVVMQPIAIIFVVLLFSFLYKMPDFNFVVFVAVIYLVQRILGFIEQIQSSLDKINYFFPNMQSVINYEIKTKNNLETDQGKKDFKFNQSLDFERVHFTYADGESVINDINLHVKKGEILGVIGSSGAGKTTVVDLILRLLQPSSGKILLDGEDIAGIKIKSWRDNVGYVSQDIFLMNDTIANNIGFHNKNITKQEIIKAAKMAHIYDVIQKLPNKFDTLVGERGVRLSVGQRQRVALARVLARQPKILVLDEATSALDNESEVQIQQVIDGLKGKILIFVVAHRLSTVINCDKLVVLDNGKIIEEGTPEKLLKDTESYFYKVYNIRK